MFISTFRGQVYRPGPGTFATQYANSDDGHIRGYNASYSTARSTAVDSSAAASSFIVGQWWNGTLYLVYRGFIRFDTSGIGDEDVILDARLRLSLLQDASATDFDVNIYKHTWRTPLSDALEANYDASGAVLDQVWRNTSGISPTVAYATASSLDKDWINKTGYTCYMLRSSRDVNGDTPTGTEYVAFWATEGSGISMDPLLIVTHKLPLRVVLPNTSIKAHLGDYRE